MVKFCRQLQLQLRSIWMNKYNENVTDFYLSSFQRGESGVPMLAVRAILTTIAVAIFIWATIEDCSPYGLLYLTNWGLILIVLMFTAGLNVSIIYFINQSKKASTTSSTTTTKYLPWYVSVYWAFFNVTVTIVFMISFLYWTLIFGNLSQSEEKVPKRMFWLDIMTHGVTSCLTLSELLITRTPVYVIHIVYPLVVGIVYILFTLLYYLCGGKDCAGNRYIYELLNWEKRRVKASVVAILSIIGVMIMYVLVVIIAYGRDKFSKTFVR